MGSEKWERSSRRELLIQSRIERRFYHNPQCIGAIKNATIIHKALVQVQVFLTYISWIMEVICLMVAVICPRVGARDAYASRNWYNNPQSIGTIMHNVLVQ